MANRGLENVLARIAADAWLAFRPPQISYRGL